MAFNFFKRKRLPKTESQIPKNNRTVKGKQNKGAVNAESGGAVVPDTAKSAGAEPKARRAVSSNRKDKREVAPKQYVKSKKAKNAPANTANSAAKENKLGWYNQFLLDAKARKHQRKEALANKGKQTEAAVTEESVKRTFTDAEALKEREIGEKKLKKYEEKAEKHKKIKEEYIQKGADPNSTKAKIYDDYVRPFLNRALPVGAGVGLWLAGDAYGNYKIKQDKQQAMNNLTAKNALETNSQPQEAPAEPTDTTQNLTDSISTPNDSVLVSTPSVQQTTVPANTTSSRKLRVTKTPAQVANETPSNTTSSSSGAEHEVKLGDTLSKIASDNNMDLDKLLALNPQISNPDFIAVGDKIKLEGEPTPSQLEAAKEKIKGNKKEKNRSKKINKASSSDTNNTEENSNAGQIASNPPKPKYDKKDLILEYVKDYTDRIQNGEKPISYDAMQNEVSDFLKQYNYLDE